MNRSILTYLWTVLVPAAFLLLNPLLLQAQLAVPKHPVEIELVALNENLQRGSADQQIETQVGVLFHIQPGWHIYWKNSGESAVPTKVHWRVSNGWSTGDLLWPAPQRFIERGGIITYGYKKEVLLSSSIIAHAPEAYDEDAIEIEASTSWLVCKDICIPGEAKAQVKIQLTDTPSTPSRKSEVFSKYSKLHPTSVSKWRQLVDTTVGLEVVPSRHSVPAGVEFTMALEFQGLAPLEEPYKHIQIFLEPLPDFITPGIVQVGTGKQEQEDAAIPTVATQLLEIDSTAAEGNQKIKGIAVLSADIARTPQDLSLAWEIDLNISQSASEEAPPEVLALMVAASPFTEATFRVQLPKTAVELPINATPASSLLGMLIALVFGFIGGMLLNLMPCVLPIIGIKVMGFVGHSGEDLRDARRNALAFSSGIIATFLVLALCVVTLRSFGFQLGWGFQFQHPEFVLGLTLILFCLSLGFFNLYTFQLPFIGKSCTAVDELKPSLTKHFFEGVLATALSTPCTAPFLGTALVFAFTQPALQTIAVFLAIGHGLALPYYFLSTHPKLLERLPKPGPWMDRLRQLMGFFLLATVVWLLFILHSLSGEGSMWCVLLLLIVLYCFWLFDWLATWKSGKAKTLVTVVTLLLVLVSALKLYPKIITPVQQPTVQGEQSAKTNSLIPWQNYSDSRLEELLAQGQSVFIDFTADWCITCKANEYLILETKEVAAALEENGVVPLIADWTSGSDEITRALRRYGGTGVPLYVVIPASAPEKPTVLSTIPSKASLIEALKRAKIPPAE